MAINSVRTALQLLTGAGEVTRAKALEAAGTLLELPGVGETSARAGQLAEELIEAATANQAMITDLVRTELDRRLVVLGLARGSDLEAAQRKIEALEAQVASLLAGTTQTSSATEVTGAPRPRTSRAAISTSAARPAPAEAGKSADKPATKSAKKAAASSAEKSATKRGGARKTAARKTAAQKTAAQKTAASKTAAEKTPATKRTAKKAATKKAAARTQ
jgi:hypothetical protein